MANLQNRFQVAPSYVNKNRSQFDIPHRHLTTGNFGDLIPFYWQECLPGDTFQLDTRMFSRMSTPLYPVMDNSKITYSYFFVPNRLVWSRWAEFLGENKTSAWTQPIEYIVPHAEVVSERGSVYDHLGVPTYDQSVVENGGFPFDERPILDIDFLLPRGYHLVWNEWWRDENTTDPVLVNTGDDVSAEEVSRFQTLQKVAKFFDPFTSALPSPQKGDTVDIPLTGNAPVMTSVRDNEKISGFIPIRFNTTMDESEPFVYNIGVSPSGGHLQFTQETAVTPSEEPFYTLGAPKNLYADLSDVSATSINDLRMAFQMQRLLELQARSGSRYIEIIKASFGVTSPDARLQRPEYLGGANVDIQMQQVTQQSASDAESPLGRVGAFSKTVSARHDVDYSVTEHGFIIGVMCARTTHTYQQGLHPMWTRRGRYDFYWPSFANIGEQPIYKESLFATGNPNLDKQVFGYQEAWWEYRFHPNTLSGAFRSTVAQNLDEWHYADYYNAQPTLSSGFIQETPVNVERTLAVNSIPDPENPDAVYHDQLLFDIRVDARVSRVMPLYSIPGMIDHF